MIKHHPYSDYRFQRDAKPTKDDLSEFMHVETSPPRRVFFCSKTVDYGG